MAEPQFFPAPRPVTAAALAELAGGRIVAGDPARHISGARPLDLAGPHDIAYAGSKAFLPALRATGAGACFVAEHLAAEAPAGVTVITVARPQLAFVQAAEALFPDAVRPRGDFGEAGISPRAEIHPTAMLEPDVTVEPFAVIGARAEIGAGSVIGAGASIGHDVRIGRDVSIGAGASLAHALVGNRVIVHPGARLGQDGFGYVAGPSGHRKVPQLGRVIVQDNVEIGAGTTIDRGSGRDTVIGEGTRIDNAVHIAHNVSIGRHCVIVAQAGISGSATLGDFVVLGGQVGINSHVTIGAGAEIGGASRVKDDVPAGSRYIGYPAEPLRDWIRQRATVKGLAARRGPAELQKEGRRDE